MINQQLSLLGLLILMSFQLAAQDSITNRLVWYSDDFQIDQPRNYEFLSDGRHYARLVKNNVIIVDIVNQEVVDTVYRSDRPQSQHHPLKLQDYQFSPSESKILLATEVEEIYRRSEKAHYYLYDQERDTLISLDERGKQFYPEFSPDESKIAYVFENDLYYLDLLTGERVQCTFDGEINAVINGAADWVYEEEFKLTKAFNWSPNGETIAYLKFNEKEVPEFSLEYYRDRQYPETYTFKYPKVDEQNSRVTVHLYHIEDERSQQLSIPDRWDDFYIPRIHWMPGSGELLVFLLNRMQDHLQLRAFDPLRNSDRVVFDEINPYYINIHDNLTFLPEERRFLWTSEKNGVNQLFLYDYKGAERKELSPRSIDITDCYGYDKKSGKFFFQAPTDHPARRRVMSVDVKTGHLNTLTAQKGYHSFEFSSNYDYYVHEYSSMNTPPTYQLKDRNHDLIGELEDNQYIQSTQDQYDVAEVEFFSIPHPEVDSLNAWMITPPQMSESDSFPLLMYVYGGPNSQQVLDRWKGSYYWWFQMLAQQGYVVACVDNRGTGARGQAFRKSTYQQLGMLETEDQIMAAEFFGDHDFIDEKNIAIFGWSYGGYLSSLALLKGNDVFKAAVAVAPVTNWKWYDSIYTERYMRSLAGNRMGYDSNAPIYYADRLKGDYLIIHGLADDNVHFQHTAEMMKALVEENKQFDAQIYPNKDHGIYGGMTRLHLFIKVTEFLNRSLRSS